ncbi:protein phosphatase 2A regulatory subunit CDC55 KNAG_0G01320 [Huiozyma naganishii CBS 8797]|uniref:Protein phosphatase PP2A regulatory subunit B n=1 Tax=Huiozyma naganishii (strain ATCC MYA-139 / BCRC 22969 / CBS 8797 / KCTC 17520 / NBRC 10181 / NCYC 3082 / Yp74L-3) TaxID=1071383 RepID=J7R8J3_HUIN7|nr:hypothetical protein KNAG_0G01320 [Kazachstania naganishii CBS 8797]CCK71190.1 hypothetical protein KNAG_0G01320 [Kazachstania naganishii CBS 8797]
MGSGSFNFKFSQCFGDKADIVVTEADIITSVEYDASGDFLATGDKGGRVVLFERNRSSKHCEYKFLTEFQSHDAEFDYLKSLEIEEKINHIKWLRPIQRSHFLLSTNDKTIKLWKIYEKNIKLVNSNNLEERPGAGGAATQRRRNKVLLSMQNLKLPQMAQHDKIIAATPKRVYANAHTYHINSISPNSDQETFLSADDLRINLWNYDKPDQSFNVVDIKPANMEELTEVITSACFHPVDCNHFMHSSSKGTIKLCDMRQNALCDNRAMTFEEYTNPINHNFFTEITSSISDIKFSPNGRYIAARDYLTVKIWDINMNSKPVKTINIHDQLKDRLSDTYENDAIFDKFEVNFSGDSRSVMTGSYNNNFMIYPNVIAAGDGDHPVVETFDAASASSKQKQAKPAVQQDGDETTAEPEEIVLQADKTAFRNKQFGSIQQRSARTKEWGDDIDFKKSILHFSWHPRENSLAIAATNNLFIFSAL